MNHQRTTMDRKPTCRQFAFMALRSIGRGTLADEALDRVLGQAELNAADRRLLTELVYGSVRRRRTLDALVDQLARKKARQQSPDVRVLLHLGLYQLRYLSQVPQSAAVNSTVELAKQVGLKGLAGFVNGVLRQYVRLVVAADDDGAERDPLQLPLDPVERLGVLYSYPDWLVADWVNRLGLAETEALCGWLNRSPGIDLRVNVLRADVARVEAALQSVGVAVSRLQWLPQGLRFEDSPGLIPALPGFQEGWWTVQDGSAQLVGQLVDPQPGEVVIDACAAPGGKTTHLAELMGDRGTVWGCDRNLRRLKKLQQNIDRLKLHCIQIRCGDSRNLPEFTGTADRVLLDAPCSGSGTLHRRADARWRHTLDTARELTVLQEELLTQAATWVKPGGRLVYATCTLHSLENQGAIERFLARHPHWQIEPPGPDFAAAAIADPEGWIEVWPHRQQMDGFFMVRLKQKTALP